MSDQLKSKLVDFECEVSEMTGEIGHIVNLDQNRVRQLTEANEDEHPEFPILRIESGESKQGNVWTPEILRSVAEQVNENEPIGYLGHIKPEDDGFAFPEAQTIWLKAVSRPEGDKEVLYVKGYNFHGTKIRTYLKSGVTKVASWRGKMDARVVGGKRHVTAFKLESIDWSRKMKAGMSAQVVAIASEMEGGENEVEWAKVTLDELRRENPSLFTLMKQEVEQEQKESISEMEDDAKVGKEAKTVFQKLREILGIDEKTDVVEAVTEVVTKSEKVSSDELKSRITEILGKKVKNEKARSTLLRLMPVTEMAGIVEDGDLEKKVEDWMTKDEDAKAIVSEMEQAPAPLSRSRGQSGEAGSKVGSSGMVVGGSTKL